jgi:hypothetical protein
MPPNFTFIPKLHWLYPPYSRRHLTSFGVVATYLHSFVIPPSPFRSQIVFFIQIMSAVHVMPIYRRLQASLPAACYSLGIHAVMSFFRRHRCVTRSSHGLVIAIIFRSWILSFIPTTSMVYASRSRYPDSSSSANLVACGLLQPRYSYRHIVFRRHRCVTRSSHGLVIAIIFRSRILSFIPTTSGLRLSSRHPDLSWSASLVACYILGIHVVMSFFDVIAAQLRLLTVSSLRPSSVLGTRRPY